MTETSAVNSAAALGKLKAFQRRTVEHVFRRLWTDQDATHRFLVADEVGLGKTMVARGVIALTIEHLRALNVPRIDVIYICSNAEIARQNIARLNVTGGDGFVQATRLTMLPEVVHDLRKNGLNFVSFTPGTSFEMGRRSSGMASERVVLYRLLRDVWRLDGRSGAINVFRDRVKADRFRAMVDARDDDETPLDAGIKADFEAAVKGEPDLQREFQALEAAAPRVNSNVDDSYYRSRRHLISRLRRLLAKVCINALEPDLVILDEFQRFKHLIAAESDDDSQEAEARELARALFEYESQDAHGKTRVLLLSATPYRMYTQATDAGDDDHYGDFLSTLAFLKGSEAQIAPLQVALRDLRSALLSTGTEHEQDFRPPKSLLEHELRQVMVRTERLSASADRNGMLVEVPMAGVTVTPEDVIAHHEAQRLARLLEHPDVTEYWKAAPYIGTFGGGYKYGDALKDSADEAVAKHLESSRHLTVPREMRDGEASVAPPHPRMRWLLAELDRDRLFTLPWLPPSLAYYDMGGTFQGLEGQVTKRLIFSAWQMVPKAIAALVSLEAERRAFGRRRGSALSDAVDAAARPLSFDARAGAPSRLNMMGLLYPSPALAVLGDPLRHASHAESRLDARGVRSTVEDHVRRAIAPLVASSPQNGREDDRWYWAVPVLLDATANAADARAWFNRSDVGLPWTASVDDSEPGRNVDLYVSALAQRVLGQPEPLGRPPSDIVAVTAALAVGSPAVCALRALTRGREAAQWRTDVRDCAALVAGGFRSYFNAPAMIRSIQSGDDDAYWQAVANAGVDGCLQAVLDEWAHVLPESLGLADALDAPDTYRSLAEVMREALTLRAGSVSALDLSRHGGPEKPTAFRSRMAARFGDQREGDGESMRPTSVRAAFNSPFWPFVLASTSVGQEGLDFHQYCHAIVHWNLPHNPVDLEQREGRVHRYKGHAVRRNAARLHGTEILRSGSTDPWVSLFERATTSHGDGTDIAPFWVLPAEGGAKIERHVPSLPLSRESGRLEHLRKSLVLYRMVFGQPRQDELVAYLAGRLDDEAVRRTAAELRIDLTPSPEFETSPPA